MIIPFLWFFGFLSSFYFLPVSDGIQTAVTVSALVLCAAYAIAKNPLSSNLGPLSILVAGLWGIAAFSALYSEVKLVSLTYLFFFSAFPLTFFICRTFDSRIILNCVRFIILVLGCISLTQFYFIPSALQFGGTHWPFADNNSLGAILAIGCLLFYGEALHYPKNRVKLKADLVCAAILFAGIITTEGRAVIIGFFLVAIVMTLLSRPVSWRPVLVFCASVLVLLTVMDKSHLSFSKSLGFRPSVFENYTHTPVEKPNRLSGSRYMIWDSASNIIKQHPLTGTGIGTFFLYYPEWRNPLDDSAGYMAHNDMIQFAVEMGIMAPLISLMIVSVVLGRTWFMYRQGGTADDRLSLIVPVSVFGLLTGHSLVNFNFYVLPSLMIIGLALAILDRAANQQNKISPSCGLQTRLGLGVVVSVVILIPLWSVTISEYKTREAMNLLSQGDIKGFADSIQLADTLSLGQNSRALLQAAQFARATEDFAKAKNILEKAEQADPRNVHINIEQAILLKEENPEMALTKIRMALQKDPSSIAARMVAADILQKTGKDHEAYTILKGGLVGQMRDHNPRDYYRRLSTLSLVFADTDTQAEVLQRLKDRGE